MPAQFTPGILLYLYKLVLLQLLCGFSSFIHSPAFMLGGTCAFSKRVQNNLSFCAGKQ